MCLMLGAEQVMGVFFLPAIAKHDAMRVIRVNQNRKVAGLTNLTMS